MRDCQNSFIKTNYDGTENYLSCFIAIEDATYGFWHQIYCDLANHNTESLSIVSNYTFSLKSARSEAAMSVRYIQSLKSMFTELGSHVGQEKENVGRKDF